MSSLNDKLIHERSLPWWMQLMFTPLGWLLYILSFLPFRLLYLLADFIAFLLRSVLRYRMRIVKRNVTDCMPEITETERKRIVKSFYHHLGNYFVETLKFRTIGDECLKRRMMFCNTELIDTYLSQGRNIVIYTSHFGNWEWITSLGLWCESSSGACFAHVYRPLKQPWFDRWWLRLRGRYNRSIPMKKVLRQLLTWRKEGKSWITGFLSDQKPSHASSTFDVTFMGRNTPFIYGTEELARKLDAVVMLFDTEIVARGYYRSTIRLVTDDPHSMSEGEITRKYVANLETQIRRCPGAYLWSHNRWRIKP